MAAAPHQCQSTYAVCQAVCGQSPVLVTLYKPRDRIENLHTYGTVRPTFGCCSRNNIWGYDEPPICFKMLPTWSSKSPISQITASRGLDWSCRQLHSRREMVSFKLAIFARFCASRLRTVESVTTVDKPRPPGRPTGGGQQLDYIQDGDI